jgi:MFS superfamily sulfate permease-like transporter
LERALSPAESAAGDHPRDYGFLPLANLKGDFLGAIAATLVSLPLSMTIGVVAFMPLGGDYAVQGVLTGIYGAVILGFVAATLGGRSILVSGPRAASALILASLISQLLLSEDLMFPSGQTIPNVISIAFFTILLAGAIQAACGATRMANIVKNIPYPVIAGFINSSALLIILGQSWTLLDIRRQDSLLEIFEHLDETRPIVLIPAIVTIATMLLTAKRFRIPMVPAPLAGLATGTAVFYLMRYVMKGADVGGTLGEVTSRLPTPQFVNMFTSLGAGGEFMLVMAMVIPAAISMAALASLDTLLSVSVIDDMTETRTDSNRKLVAHGIGNMAAALMGGMIGAGGMIRTKPGYDAGGRTKTMVHIVSGLMLGTVLLLAQTIEYIPRAVISGMVLVLGFQIFDRWSLSLLKQYFSRQGAHRKASLDDAVIILLVITAALVFNLIVAVGVGIAVALIIFVLHMQRSLIRRESRGPALHARSVWNERRQAVLRQCGHRIAALELEGAVFFGSADLLEDRVRELMRGGVTHIVLDMKRITDIDSTGGLALARISQRLRKAGGDLAISYVPVERRKADQLVKIDRRRKNTPRQLWAALERSGALGTLGREQFHPDTDSALAALEDRVIADFTSEDLSATMRHLSVAPILRGLSREEVSAFRRLATRRIYRTGEVIFAQGDDGDALYYISRGSVDITIHLEATGLDKRLQSLAEGNIFGEMAILDSKPRAASVIATTDTVCYRLGVAEFEKIKGDQPEAGMKLLNNFCKMFSERMRSANTIIGELEK